MSPNDTNMAERYERDEFSFEEYSDESINVGTVCSWSIDKIAQQRQVVNIRMADIHFNSDSQPISDGKLRRLADRLQQAETGNATARTESCGRAVRASLRDYEQEAWWAAMTLRPPKRLGEWLVIEKGPNETYSRLVRRTATG